jgi:hypothetical protein
MFSNPAISRGAIYTTYSPRENETTVPDAMLTLSIIIICITSPFWLVYLLFKPSAAEGSLFNS